MPAVSVPISVAEPGGPAAGQQLEGDRGQREHVRGRVPRRARDALGRAVGAAHRCAQADPLEGFDDAEPGRAGLFGCDEDVARVQRAVADARRTREIDRAGELGDERQHGGNRRRRVVPHGDVERLGGDVLLGAIRHRPLDAGGDRLDDRGMEEACLGGPCQLIGQRLRLLGCDVETEDLHGDQPIAFRLVGAEHGTERADADLVQHPEGAELSGCSEGRRIVAGQEIASRLIAKIYHILLRGASPLGLPTRRSRGPSTPAPSGGSLTAFARVANGDASTLEPAAGIHRRALRVESRDARPSTYLDMLQNALREYDLVSADASTTAAAAATRVAVDVRRFPWVRPLAGEYAANFASVAPLYAGDPQSPDAWREVSARVRSHPGHRDHVAAAIAAQQRRRDAPEAARTAAALLANPDTVAVVTGQQAGVFGGPLYTS